ncbi:hypothetical protein G3M48_007584 [Beauveria asiatica]|uniref:Sfi1 spindle body domain-containing protein n=1 Tax=Beauveria asiatica TaxID=1069075 RepID=A0AAW0RMM9_9HYPO
MGSMAYAPFPPPKNKLPSLPHYHVDSHSPAWTSTTQDPYYSNEDIEILHEIVSIAQEKLDNPNGARPLPAAALFKAYDEVLPKHGIDPDDENHLSRLIFRVGGEKGSGSLPEKFQAVLASMGIALEYGDSSPISQRASRSSRSSSDDPNHLGRGCLKPSSASKRLHGNFGGPFTPWPSATEYEDESIELESKPAARYSPSTSIPLTNPGSYPSFESVLSGPSQPQGSQQSNQRGAGLSSTQPVITRFEAPTEDVPRLPEAGLEMPVLRAALTRPPVLAILDRWRSASKKREIRGASSLPLSDRMASPTIDTQRVAGPGTREPWQIKSPRATLFLTRYAESSIAADTKQPTVKSSLLPAPTAHTGVETSQEQKAGHHGDYTAMLNRAGRAREIYLASRAFNHWAEITAARLEKEAVARRHMIRFRCFRGWSNAPNSRASVVNYLRAATAVQKLRRAVACQEEQLRAAASAIYEIYRIHKAKRAMCQWLCSTAQQSIRRETAHRAKRGIIRLWYNQTTLCQKQAELAAKTRQCIQKNHLIHHWASKAQQAERQLAVSKQVGLARPMFTHLAAWWDHTETEQRAQVYRANLLWKRAHSALDDWNLRARAQAFVWRSDYQSATCALTKWIRVIENGRTQQCRAACAIERCQVTAALSRVEHFLDYTSKLEYYAYRARLFIMASRFLRVLDRAYEARKASLKEEIRQQLRARYKEVSSARKKRQFHSALHFWRSSAQRYTSVAAEAKEHIESQTWSLKLDAVQIWLAAASRNEEQRATGQKYAVHHVLSNWGKLCEQLAQQDAQSWNMWVQRKQRQALKSWSISSLQGSGRGHTAAMVQQRYNADKRSRAFQIWRHSRQVLEATDTRHPSVTPHHQAFNGRRSWKTISARKSTARPEVVSQYPRAFDTPAAPLDTPTRWTGRPLAVSSTLANTMPSFGEADERSATSSRFGDEAGTGYDLAPSTRKPRQILHRGLVLRPGKSASTTPQVPVPTDLRRSIEVRNTAFNKSAISTISEQSFQPNISLIKQRETGEKQLPGYTDSAIANGVSARLASRSQISPTEIWRGPTIPSRQSMRNAVRSNFKNDTYDWLRAAKTAPQPSRFAGGGRSG